MAKKPCPICQDANHSEAECPNREARDYAMIARIDGLTYGERTRLADAVRKAKRRIAPSPEARGTIVEGLQAQLPSSPPKQIEDQENKERRKGKGT